MEKQNLDEDVISIRNDGDMTNIFVDQYRPFIASCCHKFLGNGNLQYRDDAISIGMLAFYEAMRSFNMSQGHFLSFAELVIKRRLTDWTRKDANYQKHTILVEKLPEKAYVPKLKDNLTEEIARLKTEMALWQISFEQLYKDAPRHSSTQLLYRELASYILNNPTLKEQILQKRYLPVKEIVNNTGISCKVIERARRYLITVLLIQTGDYPDVASFLELETWRA